MFLRRAYYAHPEFAVGVRQMAPQSLGIAAWGLMTGVAMVKSGMSIIEALAMAMFVYAGSSQLAAIPLLLVGARNSIYALRVVNTRANLLGTTSLVEAAALDKYSFTRDAYLQLRHRAATPDEVEDETQWMNESAAEPAPMGKVFKK